MGLVFNSGVQDKEFVITFGQMVDVYDASFGSEAHCQIFNETPVPYDAMWALTDYLSSGVKSKTYDIAKRSSGSSKLQLKFVKDSGTIYCQVGYGGAFATYNTFSAGSPPSALVCTLIACTMKTPSNPTNTNYRIYVAKASCQSWTTYLEKLPPNRGGGTGLFGRNLGLPEQVTAFTPQSYDPTQISYSSLYINNYDAVTGTIPLVEPYTSCEVEQLVSLDNTEPEPYVPPAPPAPDDPNDEGEPSDEDGGDGDHDPTYDPVPIPDKPSDGVADAGFITLYRMTFREFDEFASKCFADTIWDAIKLKFNNPTDFLVGAMLLPFIPDVGLSYYPKFGLQTLDTAYPRINNQFHDIDCGSVVISKYWGSCFDYEPYTKIQIWLPYIGYKDLPVDEFMDMTINVKYRCDCLTGDCVAFVSTGVVGQSGPQIPRVIGQYYGNCGVRVPFGSQSFDAAVAAGITLIGAAAASGLVAAGSAAIGAESGAGVLMAAGAGAGSAATGAVGRSASVGVVQGMKPNVQHGGAAGASGGYMGIQTPYLIRRIPRQNLPEGFMNLKGYPSNIGGKLADFEGLAVVDEIQLNDIPAMETERKEIIDWLSGGVLI